MGKRKLIIDDIVKHIGDEKSKPYIPHHMRQGRELQKVGIHIDKCWQSKMDSGNFITST